MIARSANLTQQFDEPDALNSDVCVVLPQVYRGLGYQPNEFDLDVIIKHEPATELGQWEMYRIKDFIRQRVDLAPVLYTVYEVTGVEIVTVTESIKAQIKFLQRVENRDLPTAPAQLL